ncbi:MAG: hypothetical protein JWR32_304 [Mycobacterium sp.]|jgi:hypothetical protein|nr:hypothetical protein [Mycobacterium sp.]
MADASGSSIHVGPDQVHTAANNLESLMEQANAVLKRYMDSAYNVHNPGQFWGQTAVANTNTAEQIQHATMKITRQWSQLIDVLRNEAGKYHNREEENAALIAGLAGNV